MIMNTTYISPAVTIIALIEEGLLCASVPGALELPDVNWNDETEW